MSNIVDMNEGAALLEKVVVEGDLSKLLPTERLSYYQRVCESVGLNPLTKPFDYIKLNGKLTLYARKDATDQLRKIHSISINITSREKIGDIYVVTARAKSKDGREDESIGAVSITNLEGNDLANALMKAETKAKRRVTLSIAGLGMLDESELESISPEPIHHVDQPVQVTEPSDQSAVKSQQESTTDHKNTPSDQPASKNLSGQEFTLVNMEIGKAPSGTPFAKIIVNELQTPILAKGEVGVKEANKIDGGEGSKVVLEVIEESGFIFLKKVIANGSVAA